MTITLALDRSIINCKLSIVIFVVMFCLLGYRQTSFNHMRFLFGTYKWHLNMAKWVLLYCFLRAHDLVCGITKSVGYWVTLFSICVMWTWMLFKSALYCYSVILFQARNFIAQPGFETLACGHMITGTLTSEVGYWTRITR
jgi:hypothetical protein